MQTPVCRNHEKTKTMQTERFIEIKEFLRQTVLGTEWQDHVFVVGGCVRDQLLGLEIKDIDICVSLPSGGVRFAQWLHDQDLTVGDVVMFPAFGTAMVRLQAFPDVELEMVQTRKEKYTDRTCRNPVTAFGTIQEDALRRDLTINSLSVNISTGETVDVTGHGVQDLKDHILRTPVDPDVTFDDDPLRILRCIRFASRLGWEIEQETFDGMVRNVDRLSIICKERIQAELEKMLTSAHPVLAMELLHRTGAMRFVIPLLEETVGMTQNVYHKATVWQHTLDVLGSVESDSHVVRMAALLHDIGKLRTRTETDGKVHFIGHEKAGEEMVWEVLRPLRVGNDFMKSVSFLVGKHMATKQWGAHLEHMKPKQLRKLQFECGTESVFRDLMMLVDADNRSHAEGHCMPDQVRLILEETERMKAEGSAMFGFRLPLNGHDVMEVKGLESGKAVQKCLDFLMKVAFVDPLQGRDGFVRQLKGFRV